MNKTHKLIIGLIAFIGLVGIGYKVSASQSFWDIVAGKLAVIIAQKIDTPEEVLGGTTNFNDLAVDSITVSGVTTLTGELTAGRVVQGGTVEALTGVASSTLTAAQVCDNAYVTIAPVTSTPTVTLPASSTLFADCLTANGQYVDVTVGAITTSSIISAGTGGSLDFSESAEITDGEFAIIRLQRVTDNAYQALLTNLNN